VLLADAIVYSTWVVLLFATAALAPTFNRWTRAELRTPPTVSHPLTGAGPTPGVALMWLGLALLVGLGAARVAALMPVTTMFTATSWTVLFATLAGLIVARTPLARLPGTAGLASALLALLVAVLASQSNFQGMGAAPLFVLCGFCALLLHIALLALAARLFRFDMHLSGISSLAQIGGVATAPVLAATYSPVLVPIAVLLAMLGLVLGTGIGLFMASVLSALAPGVS
jgi:uncharacterized membrane protein